MQGYPPPPPGGGGPPGGGPPGGPYDPNFYGQQPPGAAPGYGPPGQPQQQPFGAPQQGYGAPQQGAPQNPYGAPPQGYGAPQQPYGAPPGYGPPGAMMAQGGAPFGVDPLSGMPYSDKSKMVAGILQLFVGSVGAGRWYTGHTGIAIAQLLTCGGFGLWALIDAILMFTGKVPDAQGRPLRD